MLNLMLQTKRFPMHAKRPMPLILFRNCHKNLIPWLEKEGRSYRVRRHNNKFIRQFHQSRIPNLQFFLNVYCDFFFKGQTKKTPSFGPINNLLTNLVRQIGELSDEFIIHLKYLSIRWSKTTYCHCKSIDQKSQNLTLGRGYFSFR